MNELTYKERTDIGLEYVLSLLNPSSPYGAKAARHLRFYKSHEAGALETELENVERVKNTLLALREDYEKLERLFMQLKDIRHSIKRCEDGVLSEVELFEIKRFLLQLGLIAPLYAAINERAGLKGIEITEAKAALEKLSPDGEKSAGFHIDDRHSPALRQIRREKRAIEERIRVLVHEKERDALLRERALIAAREDDEETRIRALLSEELRPHVYELMQNTDAIERLDFTLARARLALAWGAGKPTLTEEGVFIEGMENPRVADALRQKGKSFTPVSIELTRGAAVITGANMGGKSVALKTLTLTVLLVQAGIFPHANGVKTQLFDRVFLLLDDLENANKGLSSFGAEIVRLNEILKAGGQNNLVVLDELARGTNPYEGAEIVRAVTKRLNELPWVSVLSTHYDHVAEHANAHYQVTGLRGADLSALKSAVEAAPDHGVSVVAKHMNYGLFKAPKDDPCPRDALNVCRLLGLDQSVLKEIEKAY